MKAQNILIGIAIAQLVFSIIAVIYSFYLGEKSAALAWIVCCIWIINFLLETQKKP